MYLNDNEIGVLKACADNAMDAAGGDFGYTNEIAGYIPELSSNQIKGYLSDLQNKGLIAIDSVTINENDVYHQITFEKDVLKILVKHRMMTTSEAEKYDCWYR